MGVSTDAILAFGFNLVDEGDDKTLAERFGAEDEGDFDFEEWLAERAGAVYPENHSGIDSPEYQAYSQARRAAIAACPVEIILHCSYDYPMYFLALRGSQKRANRGYPQAITTEAPSQERIAAMRALCEQHGIDWQEPSWHIFSLWG